MFSWLNGGWSAEDHDVFLYVTESYTNDLANRRLLYIDCLQRCLPHKTRSHIVSLVNLLFLISTLVHVDTIKLTY